MVARGDEAITNNALVSLDLYNAALWWRGALSAASNIDKFATPATYPVPTGIAAELGIPVKASDYGRLEVYHAGNAGYATQVYVSHVNGLEYIRRSSGSTWVSWSQRNAPETLWKKINPKEVTQGEIAVKRIGNLVFLSLEDVVFGSRSGTFTLMSLIPEGYQPSGKWVNCVTAPVLGPSRGYRIKAQGNVEFFDIAMGDALHGSATAHCDQPWPIS